MKNLLTPEILGDMDRATTLEELATIALTLLARMSVGGEPVIQICGPMGTGGLGTIAANVQFLEAAIAVAQEHGYQVFDQTVFSQAIARIYPPTSDPVGRDIRSVLVVEKFNSPIITSGLIAAALFLPNWGTSVGTTMEYGIVIRSIRTLDYPQHLLSIAIDRAGSAARS